jgi:hypothetical protein
LAIGLVLGGTPSAQAQLRPEPDAIKLAPRELIDRLRASPTDYFRFVNRPWIARVCEVFAADLPNVPIVRLHGDAHIEQFAATEDAWGLDDFDDSARGPALEGTRSAMNRRAAGRPHRPGLTTERGNCVRTVSVYQ